MIKLRAENHHLFAIINGNHIPSATNGQSSIRGTTGFISAQMSLHRRART